MLTVREDVIAVDQFAHFVAVLVEGTSRTRTNISSDLRWIQKAMGHASITTTARTCAHLYDDELDAVAAALNGLRGGK